MRRELRAYIPRIIYLDVLYLWKKVKTKTGGNKQSLRGHHSSDMLAVFFFKCHTLQERHQEVEGLMKTISKQKARPPAAGRAAWCSDLIGTWECHRATISFRSMPALKGRSLERTCTLKLFFSDLMWFDEIEEQADRRVILCHALRSVNGHDNHHWYPLKTVLRCRQQCRPRRPDVWTCASHKLLQA